MAAVNKLSPQDRRDFDKFTKFLALKAVQVIVQSRLGDKLHTQCNPHVASVTDWFNLAITDIAEVAAEAKKVLQGDSIISRLPLCVEISLKTVDGDQMILENWTLGILQDQCDPSVKIHSTVYYWMKIMLRSLISATRITPAYKLSRQQGTDSYVIYYRIYSGEPQCHNLGEGYKQAKVGQLCGPLGTLYMSVAYRTKMTMTPVQTQQGTSIMVKSDHFHSDLSPKHIRYNKQRLNWDSTIPEECKNSVKEEKNLKDLNATNLRDKKKVNLDKPMKVGAFVDTTKVTPYKETDFILPEDPPFSWLLEDPRKRGENYEFPKTDSGEDQFNFKDDDSENVNDDELQDMQENITPETRNSIWSIGPDDDKFMKELQCPFATAGPVGELAKFYRECDRAPPLQSFMDNGTEGSDSPSKPEDPTMDITKQLEMFEISLLEYDKMVSSLCQSPNNN